MSTADSVLLDTHALLWWQAGGERLSNDARAAIDGATALRICPITFWEIAMLAEKGRIELDRDAVEWTNALLTDDRIIAADLEPAVAASAGALPGFHGDPADRLIYATARRLAAVLVTKDSQLHRYAESDPRVTATW
jgi:PIN domain nuclease of toxin-antitoxin system